MPFSGGAAARIALGRVAGMDPQSQAMAAAASIGESLTAIPAIQIDPRAILSSIGEAVYDWDIGTDKLSWSGNATELNAPNRTANPRIPESLWCALGHADEMGDIKLGTEGD